MAETKKASGTDKPQKDASESGTEQTPEEVQMVLTIRTETGEITNAEWMTEGGERTGFSDEEWAVLAVLLSSGQSGDVTLEAAYQASPEVYEIAYHHGMVDYETCLVEEASYTPEQLAYYQGAADYASLLS